MICWNSIGDRITRAGGRGVTANRVLAAIRKLFSWAIQRGIVTLSPVAGITAPVAEKARDRILTDAEILSFWQACGELGYPFGDMAKLLLLTGQRRNEVAQMTWGELNVEKALWSIPGERTKNGKPHGVPLSGAAIEIINSLPHIEFWFLILDERHNQDGQFQPGQSGAGQGYRFYRLDFA